MTPSALLAICESFTNNSPLNYISTEAALRPELAGLRLFDPPLLAFGAADDVLYERYQSPEIIGPHHILPRTWLPTADTVVAFFLPYAERVKRANAVDNRWPADEWLHGRFEGQVFVQAFAAMVVTLLTDAGFEAVAPMLDDRYQTGIPGERFTSNWSERHAAYAAGLGTFGLSKGLITEKGVCGRLGSVVTSCVFPKKSRLYTGIYDYCDHCGICAERCPVRAITPATGKRHAPCSDFLDAVRAECRPRYGCGKCQTGVPCESGIPDRK